MMAQSSTYTRQPLETELQISPNWIIAGLVIAGISFVILSDGIASVELRRHVHDFATLLYAAAAGAWAITSWRYPCGRWFVIISLAIIINIGMLWLGFAGFFALIVLPTALAAALISLEAAVAISLGQTAFLTMWTTLFFAWTEWPSVLIALVAIWVILGLIVVLYRLMHQNTRWSWEHFQRAQQLLEESRNHKMKLEQALTELANANRQLTLMNERVATMREAAEEAQKTKTVFVAKVSHEFRTPLNMIIGLTDLLTAVPEVYGQPLSPALLEDLHIVNRNCEHLAGMINDVLDLSQTETGHLTLRKSWVNLAETIQEAVTVVQPLLEKKQLYLCCLLPGNLPEIYCDQTRIRQVILNLASNAARFTTEGGITVKAWQEDRFVLIHITDTGPGISPLDIETIFDPFCQGTSNPWLGQSGSGLGLSISKQFVEMHQGEIWVESTLGQGSTFAIKLPISPPNMTTSPPARWVNENWALLERTDWPDLPKIPYKQRVVVCDALGELHLMFSHQADEVEFVNTHTLEQAVEAVQSYPAHALVLNAASASDVWPLVEAAKLAITDTPIIACNYPSQMKEILDAGAVDYLTKPVMRKDLEEVIQAVEQPLQHILIADDDPELQQLLRRMLLTIDHTFRVSIASDGEQALDCLRRLTPDLMFLDLDMPNLDGWQTLRQKNEDDGLKHIPVILISAHDYARRPITSELLVTSIGQGISIEKALQGSLAMSALLLH